jgi:hypothetical protein
MLPWCGWPTVPYVSWLRDGRRSSRTCRAASMTVHSHKFRVPELCETITKPCAVSTCMTSYDFNGIPFNERSGCGSTTIRFFSDWSTLPWSTRSFVHKIVMKKKNLPCSNPRSISPAPTRRLAEPDERGLQYWRRYGGVGDGTAASTGTHAGEDGRYERDEATAVALQSVLGLRWRRRLQLRDELLLSVLPTR